MKEYELRVDEVSGRGTGPSTMVRVPGGPAGKVKEAPLVVGLPPENQEVVVELRDPESLASFRARALFASKPEEHPDWDKVWFVRTPEGRQPHPWAVKIIERFEEEEREVKSLPTRRLSIGERKGRMLIDMLKEREEKMKKGGPPGPPSKPS